VSDEIKRLPENAPDWTIPTDLGGVPTTPGAKGAGKGGPSRRTVLAGAAWTVPVIALAVATPLAAASTTELTLTFVDGPYSAVACGPIDDITIHAAQNGAPAAATPVTVTLPAGITWSDGTTGPRVMTTDASGNVVLTGLKAPNSNGDFALVAQSGTATATTVVTSVGANSGVISQFGGGFLPALPAGVLIEDVQTNTTPQGTYTIIRGSDGNAYVSSNTGSGWSAWTKSGSPLAGSITDVAISNQGSTNILAGTTTISLFGGGVSTPLPGGATIQDVQSYTTAGPTAVAVVLGSDGRAYSNTYNNSTGWTGWVPTALANATHIAVSESGGGAVVATAQRVAPVGGGAASPVLPGGATIQDVTTNVNANGVYGVAVTGSNGQAYTATFNSNTGTWTNWTAATSLLNGSIQHLTQSKSTGSNTFLGSSNRVSLFGGAGGATPPLPNGATIVDMQGSTSSTGIPSVTVLGSDGRAYISEMRNGAWTPWKVSRVGQSNLEFISVSEGSGWNLVASNPLC
jgi:hypothetical protein